MEENILEIEEIEFDEELAKINLEENTFENEEYEKGGDEDAGNES